MRSVLFRIRSRLRPQINFGSCLITLASLCPKPLLQPRSGLGRATRIGLRNAFAAYWWLARIIGLKPPAAENRPKEGVAQILLSNAHRSSPVPLATQPPLYPPSNNWGLWFAHWPVSVMSTLLHTMLGSQSSSPLKGSISDHPETV